MKIIIISSAIMLLLIQSNKSQAQQADSTGQKSVSYMSQYLKTDTATAAKVKAIQENYKKALLAVIADSTMNIHQKRAAVEKLMDEKNEKLEPLFPVSQLEKIIPTTERKRKLRGSDSTAVNQ